MQVAERENLHQRRRNIGRDECHLIVDSILDHSSVPNDSECRQIANGIVGRVVANSGGPPWQQLLHQLMWIQNYHQHQSILQGQYCLTLEEAADYRELRVNLKNSMKIGLQHEDPLEGITPCNVLRGYCKRPLELLSKQRQCDAAKYIEVFYQRKEESELREESDDGSDDSVASMDSLARAQHPTATKTKGCSLGMDDCNLLTALAMHGDIVIYGFFTHPNSNNYCRCPLSKGLKPWREQHRIMEPDVCCEHRSFRPSELMQHLSSLSSSGCKKHAITKMFLEQLFDGYFGDGINHPGILSPRSDDWYRAMLIDLLPYCHCCGTEDYLAPVGDNRFQYICSPCCAEFQDDTN